MKRVLAKITVLIIMFMFAGFFVGCTDRMQVLKVYNWEDYISPEVASGFEQYYYENTHKTVRVEYNNFATTEEAYSQIKIKKEDYDLIVPSDYTLGRMRDEGLLIQYDANIVFAGQGITGVIDNNIVDIVRDSFDADLQYCVPYLYGTVGILYDSERGGQELVESVTSWEAVFGDKFKGKIYMKDSVHDAFAIGSVWANYQTKLKPFLVNQDLQGYQDALKEVMKDTSDENIDRVRQVLVDQKANLLKYENDDAKDAMAVGSSTAGLLALAWSTDAGFAMNDNKDLRYVVPNEGSNVYIDAFAIPKYAKNIDAANWFLRYINTEEVAFDNMDYTGSPSPVLSAYENYRTYLEEESDFFDGASPEFKDNYLDMFFTPESVLGRTAYFVDFGDRADAVNQMWIGVKSGKTKDDYLPWGSAVAFSIIGGLLVYFIVRLFLDNKK